MKNSTTVKVTPINFAIEAIPALKDNYIWALIDKRQSGVVIVDPGEAQPVLQFLQKEKLSLAGILITHHHWDHTQGIAEIIRHFKVPVVGPDNEQIEGKTQPIQAGASLSFLNFSCPFEVLAIPGHTLGHLAYYSQGNLFCGDTLFAAGCGRLFEGTAKQLYDSLQTLAGFPPQTKIYSAHEYALLNLRFANRVEPQNTQILERIERVKALRNAGLPSLPSLLSEELATNPFLRCHFPALREMVETYAGQQLSTELEIFTFLRKWKDEFK